MHRALATVLAMAFATLLVIWLGPKVVKGLGALGRHLARFVTGVIDDSLQIVSCWLVIPLFIFCALGSVIIGRWSAAVHYGRQVERELGSFFLATYRLALQHPFRLIGLHRLPSYLEFKVVAGVGRAPGRDRPGRSEGKFPGYRVLRSLPAGGSGARIYVATPEGEKESQLARAVPPHRGEVVIKSFSLYDGSDLPQVVRESRALEASRNLGLVLEHAMDEQRFYYVMPYVPGEDLAVVTRKLHDACGPEGLGERHMRQALGHIVDLLADLDRYHRQGLWHKDIKPENVIVSGGRAHLVDLGLVTHLQSGMTLTTHGTEYYRDPELVRMALRGAKVHEVDGVRFDVYGAGALLYSLFENSFPAHGALSRLTKTCPETVTWIVRRAMAEVKNRYATAEEMRRDALAVLEASDPFALRPADLPSMGGVSTRVGRNTPRAEPTVEPVHELPVHAGAVESNESRHRGIFSLGRRRRHFSPKKLHAARTRLNLGIMIVFGVALIGGLFASLPGSSITIVESGRTISRAEAQPTQAHLLGLDPWIVREQDLERPVGDPRRLRALEIAGIRRANAGRGGTLVVLDDASDETEREEVRATLRAHGFKLKETPLDLRREIERLGPLTAETSPDCTRTLALHLASRKGRSLAGILVFVPASGGEKSELLFTYRQGLQHPVKAFQTLGFVTVDE